MGWLGRQTTRHPALVTSMVLLITFVLLVQATHMEIKTDLEEFLPDMEEVRVLQNISTQEYEPLQLAFAADNALSRQPLLSMVAFEEALMRDETVVPYLKDPSDPHNSTYSLAYMVALTASLASFAEDLDENISTALNDLDSFNPTALLEMGDKSYSIAENLTILVRETGNQSFFNLTLDQYNLPINTSILVTIFDPDLDPQLVAEATQILTPPKLTENATFAEGLVIEFYERLNESDPEEARVLTLMFVRLLTVIQYSSDLAMDAFTSMLNETQWLRSEVLEAKRSWENGSDEGAVVILKNASSRLDTVLSAVPYDLYVTVNESAGELETSIDDGIADYKELFSVRSALSNLRYVADGVDAEISALAYEALEDYLYHRETGFLASKILNVTSAAFGARIQEYDLLESELDLIDNLVYVIETMPAMAEAYLDAALSQLDGIQGMLEEYSNEIELYYNITHSSEFAWYLNANHGLLHVLSQPDLDDFKKAIIKLHSSLPNINVTSVSNLSGSLCFLEVLQGNYSVRAKRASISVMHEALTMPRIEVDGDLNYSDVNKPSFELDIATEREIIETWDYQRLLKLAARGGPEGLLEKAQALTNRVKKILPAINTTLNKVEKSVELLHSSGLEESGILDLYESFKEGLVEARSALMKGLEVPEGISELSEALEEMYERVALMASKDFDGSRASAGLVIVYLNQPQGGEEDIEFFSSLEKHIIDLARQHWDDVEGFAFAMLYGDLNDSLVKTRKRLVPVAFLVVLFIIVWIMRRPFDVLISILGIGMAIIWAYGLGTLMGFNMNQIVVTVAVILVGLSIDYSIHVTTRYAEEFSAVGNPVEAGRRTVSNLGLALFLSMFTTAVAFLSNLTSPIPPVRHFGLMLAVGIISAFLIFVTFGVSTRTLYDRRGRGPRIKHVAGVGEKLSRISAASYRKPLVIFTIATLISGFMAYQLTWLHVSFDLTDFLPQYAYSTKAYNYFLDTFKSGVESTVYLYLEGNFSDPEILKAEKKLEENLLRSGYVSEITLGPWKLFHDTYIHNDTFRELVDENDLDGDGLPDRNLSSVWEWLRLNDQRFENVFLQNVSSAVIELRPSSLAWKNTDGFVDYLYGIARLAHEFKKVVPTGGMVLYNVIQKGMLKSLTRSIIFTLGLAMAVLIIVFSYLNRSPMFGFITAIPVSLATIWLLGSIHLLGQSLNVLTVTEASLIFGVGIDYAVHVAVRFVEERRKGKDVETSVLDSIRSTGAAIMLAALTTVGGFGTLALSDMPHIRMFGILSSLGIAYSLFLTIIVFPALVSMWAPTRE